MSLGKGLGSLIPMRSTPANINNQAVNASINKNAVTEQEVEINLVKINPQQPRVHFDANQLEDLVQSIREYGIIQPIIVTQIDSGYELIAGERRLRAAKLAGLKKVPIIIREASDLEKLELALIENIQRSDLHAIEKAEGYKKLVHEFGLTQEQAAQKMGISRSAFTNTLRLLKLPAEIQEAIAVGKISEGHAKIILSLPDENQQLNLFHKIIGNHLSVHDTESLMQQNNSFVKKKKKISYQDPQISAYQDELSEALATKVKIQKKAEGGIINIEYYSASDLSVLVKKIAN